MGKSQFDDLKMPRVPWHSPEGPALLALEDLGVVDLPAVHVHGVAARGHMDALVQVA